MQGKLICNRVGAKIAPPLTHLFIRLAEDASQHFSYDIAKHCIGKKFLYHFVPPLK